MALRVLLLIVACTVFTVPLGHTIDRLPAARARALALDRPRHASDHSGRSGPNMYGIDNAQSNGYSNSYASNMHSATSAEPDILRLPDREDRRKEGGDERDDDVLFYDSGSFMEMQHGLQISLDSDYAFAVSRGSRVTHASASVDVRLPLSSLYGDDGERWEDVEGEGEGEGEPKGATDSAVDTEASAAGVAEARARWDIRQQELLHRFCTAKQSLSHSHSLTLVLPDGHYSRPQRDHGHARHQPHDQLQPQPHGYEVDYASDDDLSLERAIERELEDLGVDVELDSHRELAPFLVETRARTRAFSRAAHSHSASASSSVSASRPHAHGHAYGHVHCGSARSLHRISTGAQATALETPSLAATLSQYVCVKRLLFFFLAVFSSAWGDDIVCVMVMCSAAYAFALRICT